MVSFNKFNVNPKPQTMKNLLSNKTLQATYGGDAIGGSVVRGMLGAFLFLKRKAKGRYQTNAQNSVKYTTTGLARPTEQRLKPRT
jgi:hypothetical protein